MNRLSLMSPRSRSLVAQCTAAAERAKNPYHYLVWAMDVFGPDQIAAVTTSVDNFDCTVKGSARGSDGWHILTIVISITFKFKWPELLHDARFEEHRKRFKLIKGHIVPNNDSEATQQAHRVLPPVTYPDDVDAPLPTAASVKKTVDLPYVYADIDSESPDVSDDVEAFEALSRRFLWLHACQNVQMRGVPPCHTTGLSVKEGARSVYGPTCRHRRVQMSTFLPPFMLKADSNRSVNGVLDLCKNLLALIAARGCGGPTSMVLAADLGLLMDHLAPRVWANPEHRETIFCLMSGWHAGVRGAEGVGVLQAGDGGHRRLFASGLAKTLGAAEQAYLGGVDRLTWETGTHLVEADLRNVVEQYLACLVDEVDKAGAADDPDLLARIDRLKEMVNQSRTMGPSAARWMYSDEGAAAFADLERFAKRRGGESENFKYELFNRLQFCKYITRLLSVRYIDSDTPGHGVEGYVKSLWSLAALMRAADRSKYALFVPVYLRIVQAVVTGKMFEDLQDLACDGELFTIADMPDGVVTDVDEHQENKHGTAKASPGFQGVKKASEVVVNGHMLTLDEIATIQSLRSVIAPPKADGMRSSDGRRKLITRTVVEANRAAKLFKEGNARLHPAANGSQLHHIVSHRVPTMREEMLKRDEKIKEVFAVHLLRYPADPRTVTVRPKLFDRLTRVKMPSFLDSTHFRAKDGSKLSQRDIELATQTVIHHLCSREVSTDAMTEFLRDWPLFHISLALTDSEAGNGALSNDGNKSDMGHLLLREGARVYFGPAARGEPLGKAADGAIAIDFSRDVRAVANTKMSGVPKDASVLFDDVIVAALEAGIARMRRVGARRVYFVVDNYREAPHQDDKPLKEMEQARRASKQGDDGESLAFVNADTPLTGGTKALEDIMSDSANKRAIYSRAWRLLGDKATSLLCRHESAVWAGNTAAIADDYKTGTRDTNHWSSLGAQEGIADLVHRADEADFIFGACTDHHCKNNKERWIVLDVADTDVRVTAVGMHAARLADGIHHGRVMVLESTNSSSVWCVAKVAKCLRDELGKDAADVLLACVIPAYFISGCDYNGKIFGIGKKTWWKTLKVLAGSSWGRIMLNAGLVKLGHGRVARPDKTVVCEPTISERDEEGFGNVADEKARAAEAKASGDREYPAKFFQTSLSIEPTAMRCIDAVTACVYMANSKVSELVAKNEALLVAKVADGETKNADTCLGDEFQVPSLADLRQHAPNIAQPKNMALCRNEMLQQALRAATIVDLYLLAVSKPTVMPPSALRCGFWINPSTGMIEPRFSTRQSVYEKLGLRRTKAKRKRRPFAGKCMCKPGGKCTKCACAMENVCCTDKCGCNPAVCTGARRRKWSGDTPTSSEHSTVPVSTDDAFDRHTDSVDDEEEDDDGRDDDLHAVEDALDAQEDGEENEVDAELTDDDNDDIDSTIGAGDDDDEDEYDREDCGSGGGDVEPKHNRIPEKPDWAPCNNMEMQYNWGGRWFTGVLKVPLHGQRWSAIYENDHSEAVHKPAHFDDALYGSTWVALGCNK